MFQLEMKTAYALNGYLAVEGVLTPDQLTAIREHIDALIADPENPPNGVGIGREGNTAKDNDSEAAWNDDIRGASFLVRFIPFFQDIAR